MPRSNNQHTLEESQAMNRRKVLRSPAAENLAQRGVMGHFLTHPILEELFSSHFDKSQGTGGALFEKTGSEADKNKYIRAAESSLQAP